MNNNDRINLIHRISELEGLTDRERSALLGLLRESKTYGLVWEDKPEAVEERMLEELPVLREVPERALISDSKDAPNHILIEGDNLEALTTRATRILSTTIRLWTARTHIATPSGCRS